MLRNILKVFVLCFLLVARNSAEAGLTPRPYDGLGPGVSTIGAGGDYASLQAAFAAINPLTLTGGDWDFLITSDLTEQNELYLSPPPSDFKTTFRPAPGSQPTIDFTSITGTANCWIGGFTDHFTRNIVFDGSNQPGGITRDMTLRTPQADSTAYLFHAMGRISAIAFRNMDIQYRNTKTAPVQAWATFVIVNWWDPANGVTDAVPENIAIENCSIQSNNSPNMQNIWLRVYSSGGLENPPVAGITGMRIINNDFESSERCLQINHVGSLEFRGNRVSIDSTATNFPVSAIHYSTTAGLPGLDGVQLTIEDNEFVRISAPCSGSTSALWGILLDGLGKHHQYRIVNNAFDAIQLTGSGTVTRLAGIQMTRPADGDTTAEIYHNSINILPSAATYTGTLTTSNCTGIGIVNSSSSGTFRIHNNIIRMGQPEGTAICFATPSGVLDSDGNCLYASSGIVGRFFGVDENGLQSWQQTTINDLHSTSSDPLVPSPGRWIQGTVLDDANLRFSAAHSDLFLADPIPGVGADLDGKLRGPSQTTMGAFEASDLPFPHMWILK